MPDASAIAAVTALGKTISDLIKGVGDRKLKIDLQQKVIELQGLVMETQNENIGLQAEVECLKAQAAAREVPDGYELRDNAYWRDRQAFCVRCLDEERKARRLVTLDKYMGHAQCPTCDAKYREVFPKEPFPSAPQVVSEPRREFDLDDPLDF